MEVVAERWVRKIEGARADGAEARPLHRGPVRVRSSATPRPSCAGSPSSSSCPGTTSMLRYYERAEERLAEMHRDLPGDEGKPLRPADHRKEAHLLTSKPPDPSRLARWKQDMDPAADRRLRERRRRPLLRELGYEVVDDPRSDRAERRCRRSRRVTLDAAQPDPPRRRRARRGASAGAVRRRPDPLGNDPAADDARRPPAS